MLKNWFFLDIQESPYWYWYLNISYQYIEHKQNVEAGGGHWGRRTAGCVRYTHNTRPDSLACHDFFFGGTKHCVLIYPFESLSKQSFFSIRILTRCEMVVCLYTQHQILIQQMQRSHTQMIRSPTSSAPFENISPNHCTMCTLYSRFSSWTNKVGHDITAPYCDIIQHTRMHFWRF